MRKYTIGDPKISILTGITRILKSTITYLKNFLKDKDVASVTPSSKLLVKRVCSNIDFERDITIVEYGAGTGVFSKYLLENITEQSELILFETNKGFFKKLKSISDSRLEIHNESVEKISEILGERYLGNVDYIISGIPFSFLDDRAKLALLNQTRSLLKEGGKFLAYQTSGHLKDPLREVFGNENLKTEFEFLNVPPMMVYQAVKKEVA